MDRVMSVLLLIYIAIGGLALLGTTANAMLLWTAWGEYQAAADPDSLLTLGVAALLAMAATAWVIAIMVVARRRLTRPVATLAATLRQLAEGDHAVEVPYAASTDEIGEIARAVKVLQEHAVERNRQIGREHVGTPVTNA